MAATVLAEEVRAPVFIRRFEVADLSRHGPWLLPRLVDACQLPEKMVAGWLQNFVWSDDHMFLYQDHAAALAQRVPGYGLKSQFVIQEQFVWVQNKKDQKQLEDAVDFYVHFERWAKTQGAERLIAMENSDVPQAMVEERLGRLFKFETRYARVK